MATTTVTTSSLLVLKREDVTLVLATTTTASSSSDGLTSLVASALNTLNPSVGKEFQASPGKDDLGIQVAAILKAVETKPRRGMRRSCCVIS